MAEWIYGLKKRVILFNTTYIAVEEERIENQN